MNPTNTLYYKTKNLKPNKSKLNQNKYFYLLHL